MTPTRNITIGGVAYEVQLWPTSIASEWTQRLGTVLTGPAAIVFLSDRTVPWVNPNDADWVVAARALMDNLNETGSFADLAKELTKGVVFKHGTKQLDLASQFDVHFAGRITDLLRLIRFILEVNLGDFFVALRSSYEDLLPSLISSLAAGLRRSVGEQEDPSSPSSSTSQPTGPSGSDGASPPTETST